MIITYPSKTPKIRKRFFPQMLAFSLAATGQEIRYNDTFTLYGPYGAIALRGAYSDSIPSGTWIFYDSYGRPREIQHYRNGMLQDTLFEFYEGEMARWAVYDNNRRNGSAATFHRGSLWLTQYYVNDTLNGWQKGVEEDLYFEKGLANGPCVFYSSGTPHMWGQYVNNSREGVWVKKDRYIELTTYGNNKLNGPKHWFDTDSILLRTSNYLDDEKNGPELIYGVEGSGKTKKAVLSESRNYVKGKKEGLWVLFYPNGDTMKTRSYTNNFLKGWEYSYSPEGKLTEKRYFDEEVTEEGIMGNEEADFNRVYHHISDRIPYPEAGNYSLKPWGILPVQYTNYAYRGHDTLLQSGIHGVVEMEVYVFREGPPSGVRIIQSLHPMADAEALQIACNYTWYVGRNNGIFQPGYRRFQVVF